MKTGSVPFLLAGQAADRYNCRYESKFSLHTSGSEPRKVDDPKRTGNFRSDPG